MEILINHEILSYYMNSEYIKENLHFEILTEVHDLSKFKCTSDDLTDFLRNDALKQQKMNLNITQLAVCDGEIIGFVSILTDVIKLNVLNNQDVIDEIKEELNLIGDNNEVPAIKIGRFAVDKKYAGKSLGKFIFRNVLLSILYLSKNKVGLRFITVEAYASAFNFYVEKNNFSYRKSDAKLVKKLDKIIERDPERQFNLHLDLKDIQLSRDEIEELGLLI